MKIYIRSTLITLALVALLVGGCGPKPNAVPDMNEPAVITNGELQRVGFDEMIDGLAGAQVVFVGEQHDDSLTHQLEKLLLMKVHQRQPKLALALEMFERDVQNLVDDYLAGKIDEETFLKGSRPWGNYQKAYRPLVEYARREGMPVLAMNVPRRYAAQVAMRGEAALAALPDSERVWVARGLRVLDDEYKKLFLKVMAETTHGNPMGRIDPENLYKAQCLKDDTMAESIADFLAAHPDMAIFSCEGDFHSAFGWGIVKKLQLMRDDLKIRVVSVVPYEDFNAVNMEKERGRGDYIIFVPRFQQD